MKANYTSLLKMLTAAAMLVATTTQAQSYLGAGYTPLSLGSYTTTTGTVGVAGSTYLYPNAGTAVINGVSTNIDVKVTLTSKSVTGGNPGQFSTGGGGYTGDGFDKVDGLSTSSLSNGNGPIGGYDENFQPCWNWCKNGGATASPAVTTTIETAWQFNFYVAGTATPVYLNVIPVTIDNDGSSTSASNVNEVVVYNPGATAYSLSTTTLETKSGNVFTGPQQNQSGLGTNPQYNVYAYYYNVASVSWTARHVVTGTGINFSATATGRLSSIGFAPSVTGIPTTNTPNFSLANISGSVFNDVNGLTDNTVNGTGTGQPGGTQLYAHLVSPATGLVVASVPVAANGTYSFNGVAQNTTYRVQIGTTLATPDQAPPAPAVPAGWVITGENNSAAAGNDGTADGISAGFTTTVLAGSTTSAANINFGIQQRPESAVSLLTAQTNPGGTNNFVIPAGSFQTSNVGINPNTQDYSGGTVSHIRITAFPANVTSITINGTQYTSVTWPGAGVTVPYTNGTGPSQSIAVDPVSGVSTVSLSFVSVDNAGFEDLTAGSVSIPFAQISIAGNVFNDANGLTDNTVNGTGTNAGTTLNAFLVDNTTGLIVAATTVDAAGAYNFGSRDGGSYVVRISTAGGTVGNTPPAVTLPAGWVSTGENLGAAAGSDGLANGILSLGNVSTSLTNVNFGIERQPNSDNKSATITPPGANSFKTLNGGANLPFFTGSDPEDQVSSATLQGKAVSITALPANGQLWYNGVQITAANTIISSFNPSLMQVKFTGNGYTALSFSYAYVDAAGVADPTPAVYSLSWSFALPVKLESFEVKAVGCNAVLTWTTADEKNIKAFVAERSVNGADFVAVETVDAVNEPGQHQYTTVNGQREPVAYYRLRVEDNNGLYSYSGIQRLALNCNTREPMSIWPNPAHEQVYINGLTGAGRIRIYNSTGQLIQDLAVSGGVQQLDLGGIPAGMLMVAVTEGASGQTTIIRLVKQ